MKIDIVQLEFVDKNLRNMIIWLEKQTGLEFTGTSLFRIGDDGVHGALPLRGIDLRMRNKNIGSAIEAEVNEVWEYDPERPGLRCALLHGKGQNRHLHLQVHPSTSVRS